MAALARRLALVLFCAAGSAVHAAPSSSVTPSSANDTVLIHHEAVKEQCAAIQECYCIKRTPCGWCETLGKGMLGTDDGPLDAEHCPGWVTWADDCPRLHCAEGEFSELRWHLHCGWLPLVCFVLWFVLYRARQVVVAEDTLRSEQSKGRTVQKDDEGVELTETFLRQRQERAARSLQTVQSGRDLKIEPQSPVMPRYCEEMMRDMFGRMRTFEAFRKGPLCPKDERLQEGCKRPYELNLSELSGENCESSRVGPHRFLTTLGLAFHMRTALGASMVGASGVMFVSALFLALLRTAARYLNKEVYIYLAMITKDVNAVMGPLQIAVSLLLSFYALNRVGWYWNIMDAGFIIQGRSHDMGMIGGTIKKDAEEAWQELYRLYRFVTINFYFTYEKITPILSDAGLEPLVNCGLVEPNEAEVLSRAHQGHLSVTEGWIAQWVADNLEGEAKQQSYQALRELRRGSAAVNTLFNQRAPVSFESLLYLVVYCLIMIRPFAPTNIDYNNRRAVMEGLHLATVLGDGIICAFYLALLHMLRHLQTPFNDIDLPMDALNPVAIMNSTERKLRDYLSSPDVEMLAKEGLRGFSRPLQKALQQHENQRFVQEQDQDDEALDQ